MQVLGEKVARFLEKVAWLVITSSTALAWQPVKGSSPALTVSRCYKQQAEGLQLWTPSVSTDSSTYKCILGVTTTAKLL